MTRVKICGFRDETSLAVAIERGVHAVGFVFYQPSPRFVSPEQARRLCTSLPPFVSKVGVFVDTPLAQMLDIAYTVGLDTIQLHSETYTEHFISELKNQWPFSIIKVIRSPHVDDHLIEKHHLTQANALLFDTWHPVEYGGTGNRLSLALSVSSQRWIHHKAILAGGITVENLAEILSLQPYGIDVSSGVERTKGIKDPDLIKTFLRRFYELVSQA
ncbi:MAG: phosphoribosylanthranilate isomerase [Brevinematales bacterium]|nr:phosphoribosylanthranilate isomerase [Brevinematales bacterium]